MLRLSADEGGDPERRLASLPHALLLGRIGDDMAACAGLRPLDHSPDVRLGGLRCVAARLDDQEPAPFREGVEAGVCMRIPHRVEHLVIKAFEAVGLLVQERRHCVCGDKDVVERQQRDRARAGPGHQLHDRFEDDDARSLGPGDRLPDVEVRAGQQRLQAFEP